MLIGTHVLLIPQIESGTNSGADIFSDVVFLVVSAIALYWMLRTREAKLRSAISALSNSEKSLNRNESLHRAVIDCMLEGVLIVGKDGKHLSANRAAIGLLGLAEAELVGKGPREIGIRFLREDGSQYDPDDMPSSRAMNTGRATSGETLRVRRMDGTCFWARVNSVPLLGEHGGADGAVVTFEDVTEAKVATRELQESETRLTGIVEGAMEGVLAVNPRNEIVLFNAAAEAIFGYSRSEMLDKPLNELIPAAARESHFEQMGAAAYEARKMVGKRLVHGLRKDGTEIAINVQIARLLLHEEYLYVAFVRDITDELKSERDLMHLMATLEERVEERTRELSDAYSELERFSFSVSHDLRAPLRAINGFAGILEKSLGPLLIGDNRKYLERVLANGKRMDELLDGVLTYSRSTRRTPVLVSCNLDKLLGEVVELYSAQYPAASIEVGPLGTMVGDPIMLRQIFENLVSNALKYSSKDANPTVTIWREQSASQFEIDVRDNGCGFEMENAGYLFTLFHRMHGESEYPGSGIGLAIVKRLVEFHVGKIGFQSAPGKGSTFRVIFPRGAS
jgi:PAS domain S-box-containing protein